MEQARLSRGVLPEWSKPEMCSGSGYGYGSGYGSGSGSGSGYGSPDYQQLFTSSEKNWPEAQRKRLAEVMRDASVIAFWKSDSDGLPYNGGSSKSPALPGKKEEIAGPLEICTKNALHATMDPDKWKGSRLWIVALFGEVQCDGDKYAALKREIIGEILL